jgi:hypothetical protein
MPKIGTMEYPAIALTDAVSVAEKIGKEFNGSVTTSGLAKSLSMAEKGGGFLNKVAAVKDYGLIEGRGALRLTPLGERVVFPRGGGDGDNARAEAFRLIALFARLYDRTQGRVPDEDSFEIFLQEVSGGTRMDVAKKAATVRRLFADGAQYANAASAAVESDDDRAEIDEEPAKHPASRRMSSVIELYAGEIELRLPATEQSVDVIIGVLNMLKGQLNASAMAGDK